MYKTESCDCVSVPVNGKIMNSNSITYLKIFENVDHRQQNVRQFLICELMIKHFQKVSYVQKNLTMISAYMNVKIHCRFDVY